MAYSDVDICNLALALLVQQPITDIDALNKRSRLCKTFYPAVRDYTLYKYDWPFAKRFAVLEAASDPVADHGIYVEDPDNYYPFPADCLKPRNIETRGSGSVWQQSGNGIITAISEPLLHYTAAITNTVQFTQAFIHAVKYGLAMHLAHPLTGDDKQTSKYSNAFEAALMDGGMMDMNIGSNYKNPDDNPDNDTFVTPEGLADTEVSTDYFLQLRGT